MCNKNEVITFEYKIRDSEGKLLDDSFGNPTSILLGHEQTFDAVEQALINAKPGKTLEVSLGHEDAFGERNPDYLIKVPLSKFEEDLRIGDPVAVEMEDGSDFNVIITNKDSNSYTLDANHPLAGIDLVFELKVVKKRPASPEEIREGKAIGEDSSIN